MSAFAMRKCKDVYSSPEKAHLVIWSDELSLAEVLLNFTSSEFPLYVQCVGGFYGQSDLETINGEQIMLFHSVGQQKRLIGDSSWNTISIPINFPACFVLSESASGTETDTSARYHPSEIYNMTLPVTIGCSYFTIPVGHRDRDKLDGVINDRVLKSLVKIRVFDRYTEQFFLYHNVVDDWVIEKVSYLPQYVPIDVRVALGAVGLSQAEWKGYLSQLLASLYATYDTNMYTEVAMYSRDSLNNLKSVRHTAGGRQVTEYEYLYPGQIYRGFPPNHRANATSGQGGTHGDTSDKAANRSSSDSASSNESDQTTPVETDRVRIDKEKRHFQFQRVLQNLVQVVRKKSFLSPRRRQSVKSPRRAPEPSEDSPPTSYEKCPEDADEDYEKCPDAAAGADAYDDTKQDVYDDTAAPVLSDRKREGAAAARRLPPTPPNLPAGGSGSRQTRSKGGTSATAATSDSVVAERLRVRQPLPPVPNVRRSPRAQSVRVTSSTAQPAEALYPNVTPTSYKHTDMSTTDVAEKLYALNLGRYAQRFHENSVDGALLGHMTKEMMTQPPFEMSEFEAMKLQLAMEGWQPKTS